MKNFIGSFVQTICIAQRKKAEYDIAHHLWSNEYRHESFDYILNMVQCGRGHELGYGGTR